MTTKLFHLGPPKTATTWVYHCLREHPQIVTSKIDRIHYFDIHYVRGEKWYDAQFVPQNQPVENAVKFDPTYSYICSPRAPERIAQYNPNAKLMLCLRNPVERAFSHYWHHKKKINTTTGFDFIEAIEHYNAFSTWVEHGFVGIGLARFLDYFARDSIYIMMFENLKRAPEKEFKKICNFAGIDTSYQPGMLRKKVNVASARHTFFDRVKNKTARLVFGEERMAQMRETNLIMQHLSGKSEYVRGIPSDIEKQLFDICQPEIENIEQLSGIDLSHWKTPKSIT